MCLLTQEVLRHGRPKYIFHFYVLCSGFWLPDYRILASVSDTGTAWSCAARDHFMPVAKLEIARKFGLRVEPKHKNVLGPPVFTYLVYFRWVRDRTTFKIALDRLDDALIRILLIGRVVGRTSWCMPSPRM